jgi:hypothetical protein
MQGMAKRAWNAQRGEPHLISALANSEKTTRASFVNQFVGQNLMRRQVILGII